MITDMNKVNENGERHGYWEENVGNFKFNGTYENGFKEGHWEIYLHNQLMIKRSYVKNNIYGEVFNRLAINNTPFSSLYSDRLKNVHDEDYM